MDNLNRYKEAYALCINKIRKNIPQMMENIKAFPFTVTGNYCNVDVRGQDSFYDIGNWTTSFFTGMAILAYEETKDTFFLKEVYKAVEMYEKKICEYSMETMHDLGFLYILYPVALYKVTGDMNCRRMGLKAADELLKRFNVKGGYIRAWGRMDDHTSEQSGLAIIDCMMNIPLLFWASEETGNPIYKDVAVVHANTTMEKFIREDYSVCHAQRFDIKTGAHVEEDNYCGYDVGSYWARGTAWAIYGFAIAYGYTSDTKYLEITKKIAYRFISQLEKEEDGIPVWDFRLPDNMAKTKDSSAAVVAACGLMEIVKHDSSEKLLDKWVDILLGSLCTEQYCDADMNCQGILKNGQAGNNFYSYTSWGDYYFMEALAKRLHGVKAYW